VNSAFTQILPNLADYRRELSDAGATQPLPRVPFSPAGLLDKLPAPPAGRSGWPWGVQTEPFAASAAGWPLMSVVTPSYMQGEFLEETIRSVLLQNYPNLEFVVMDGGSADASPAIIEKYRPWLSFARVASDRGQGHAINLGFSLASPGGLRGWLNSDDFYLPHCLRRVVKAARSGGGLFYGDGLVLTQATGQIHYELANFVSPRYVKYAGLIKSHAAFWAALGHQPIWEEQFCSIDYELWIRLLPGARARYIPWPLGLVRHHGAAKTFSAAVKKRWEEDSVRNGLAHPELYRSRPWLDLEHRVVQRVARWWRGRGAAARANAVRIQCRWEAPILPVC
jgi:hypothetical protein